MNFSKTSTWQTGQGTEISIHNTVIHVWAAGCDLDMLCSSLYSERLNF